MSQDFSELLSGLNAQGAEFLVVGAHAMAAHGHVRATHDLDLKRASGRAQDLADLEVLEGR